MKRLSGFSQSYFDTIIIDEAHHAISDSYQRVLDYFSNAQVLGVTATPDRGDMRNLGTIFDSLAYEYSLPQAIKEGFYHQLKQLQFLSSLTFQVYQLRQAISKPVISIRHLTHIFTV